MIIRLAEFIGTCIAPIYTELGALCNFFIMTVKVLFSTKPKIQKIIYQMEYVGIGSFVISAFTGTFTGAVLALQSYIGFKRYGGEDFIGPIVALSMVRELGPVITGLMVAGRSGSAIAAEIGTMRITEQIDALKTLYINPLQYLIIPRIIAGTIMLPLLTLFSTSCGVGGGYIVSVFVLGLNGHQYITGIQKYLHVIDIASGLIKAGCFGFIFTWVGTFKGYYTSGGARGVGNATTETVVMASLVILLANYVLTLILFRNLMIELINVKKKFNNRWVTNGVTLTIPYGQMTVIIGKSGEGKSVLLKQIIGIIKSTSVSIIIDDINVAALPNPHDHNVLKKFGYVFQFAALLDSLTIFENVGITLLEQGMPYAKILPIVQEKLRLVNLNDEILYKYPSELSGGMQKRVGLARTLVTNPQVLLYDEPTTGLDPITVRIIHELMFDMQQKLNITSIVVSHEIEIFKYADNVALLDKGIIRYVGSAKTIWECDNPYIYQFIRGLTQGPMS